MAVVLVDTVIGSHVPGLGRVATLQVGRVKWFLQGDWIWGVQPSRFARWPS